MYMYIYIYNEGEMKIYIYIYNNTFSIFYNLYQDFSFLPNLFALTFKRNKSDLCTQLFLVKNDN